MPDRQLVSCIMPTRNRRRFALQAIWYFLRQDYPDRELIIVDDGEDTIERLVPDDDRIHYHHTVRCSLGAKRNLACERGTGELIAHWDDDDWSAPDRLRLQVAALREHEADVCGARHLLCYRLDAGDAWCYHDPADGPPWLAGNTLLYRRELWASNPFPEINVGEDSAFLKHFPPERVHALPDPSFCVTVIHARNTGRKNLADRRWERRPLEEVNRLFGGDRDFYVSLRSGRPPARPMARHRAASFITVAAAFDVTTGYGSMAEYLVLGMSRAGADVRTAPLGLNLAGLSDEFRAIAERSRTQSVSDAPVLYFSWPRAELQRFQTASDLFINTMWESSRLPASWVEPLNAARAVIVPTRFVADVCRDSGVTAPVAVIPEGIDPEVYHLVERPDRPGLTTLTIGPIDDRKHIPVGIAAWKLAFADDPDARLVIKTQYNYRNYVSDDPRIRYVDAAETTRGILHWYAQADVLLALGNEGFGLPLVEAMASGLPVIALDAEGQSDACADARDLLLPVSPARWEPLTNSTFGACGVRGVPAVDDVAARLRWVATHCDEARAMGRSASAWATEHRNIWAKGPAVLDVMERAVRPARPLRRTRTLWTSSWGTPCGIAEYTAHLAGALTGVEVTAGNPDPRRTRLLHVQHEPSLYDDGTLARNLQDARRRGVAVAVTEHAVVPRTHPWEREADVLVALTSQGAGRLRERWPGKQVVHLPPGCPSWFPPRKRKRGTVIGAFGFLERHKGFWQLLDVLRARQDTELLMFSHPRSPGQARRWRDDAGGLPVRWEERFLPVEEIARRLAAEADIIAFWYDEIPHASASYAVRVGLATGVPVLASPTSWFTDLRDQTYQPGNLFTGVERLLDDTPLRERLTAAATDYCKENSWTNIAARHLTLWQALERA